VEVATHSTPWTFPAAAWIGDQAENMFQMFPSFAELSPDERARLADAMAESLSGEDPPSIPTTALLATGTRP